MKYTLYCAVNAIGVPYYDTFRPTSDKAWSVHRWRDVPKDGDHKDSCLGATLAQHEKSLKENGDRVVEVRVETSENVNFTILP
jgi:hypothetical protein